jgi:peptide/nickel transport system substrate-binding protein
MLRRLPILLVVAALIFLVVAIYLRFVASDEDTNNDAQPDTVNVQQLATPTPTQAQTATPTPRPSPTATIPAVEDFTRPVPAQLTEGLVGQIRKLNPLFAQFNPVDQDISALIFEGLTTINEFGEVVPALAERWEVSPDGLDYVFALRRDILWHDGLAFTTSDVRFTINTIRSAEFQGDQNLTRFWRTVEMTIIDDYTVRFRLVQPLASFPEHLRIGFLPQHVFGDFPVSQLDRHPANLSPIGTGPYQLEALLSSNGQIAGITLRLSPAYKMRQNAPSYAIDRLIFLTFDTPEAALSAFVAGEVNSVAHVPPEVLVRLPALPHLAVYTTVYPAVGMLIYNWQRDEIGYVREQRARNALAQALDRTQAVRSTMNGHALPADSPLILGSWAYRQFDYPVYNIEAARASWESLSFELEVTPAPTEIPENSDEAASPDTESETPPESSSETTTITMRRSLSILVIDAPVLVTLAENIAAQWRQIGITTQVEALDEATYRERLSTGDFDTAIVEYSFAPYADPDSYSFWHVGQYQDGLNYGGMRDLRISEVLEKARRETVGVNRSVFYTQFQAFFAERLPALPLYYPLYLYIADDRLEGVQLGFITTPADRFRTLPNWRWSEN